MMIVDQHTFFHQGTIAICSTLDINESIRSCGDFLKDYIPLDGISLNIYESQNKGLRVFAIHGEAHDSERTERFVSLSDENIAVVESRIKQGKYRKKPILNQRLDDTPFAPVFAEKAGMKINAHLALELAADQEHLGVLLVYSKREAVYTREHAELLALLHDPLAIALSNALRYRKLVSFQERLRDDNRFLHGELREITGEEIIGRNMGLKEVMHLVRQVASLDSNVLLLGETGVGKEVIANAIHNSSSRFGGPLVKVNCGAIPDTLIDSELFGHEKGAFTGAISRKRGRFERADGGTVFLDEVAELPPAAQVRLLRVIQTREIERVGGSEPVPVNVRIIAATHRNLGAMVKQGRFREDLWFRLNVFPLTIPALRHRKMDIPALAAHFIDRKARAMNLGYTPVPAPGALERLQKHNWPGNVRELENAVERELIRNYAKGPDQPLQFNDLGEALGIDGPAESPNPDNGDTFPSLDEAVKAHITKAMNLTKGKIQGPDGAAALLDLHPSTLRNRMRKLGLPFGRKTD